MFNKDIFKFLKPKKASDLTKKSYQSAYAKNSGLHCDRCRTRLTNDNIVLEKDAYLCTECAEKIQWLKKRSAEIDKIVASVIAESGVDVSAAGADRIKCSAEKFIRGYIKTRTLVYMIYDFSTEDNFVSLKYFEKDKENDIWYVYYKNSTKETEQAKTYYPEINEENLIEEFIKILINEELLAGKSTLIRYEEERTDKNGKIYLGCTGGWEFSEYFYDKKNNEFLEEKYCREYLDTGTVFKGFFIVTAAKVYAALSEGADTDLIRMLRAYL